MTIWSQLIRENAEKETESIPDYVDLRDQSQTLSPPGFQFPVEGGRASYLTPLHPLVPEEVSNRDSHFLRMVGAP